MSEPDKSQRRLFTAIMIAVLVWGSILALGAYLYGEERGLRNALLTLACVGAFLGIWLLLLRRKGRREALRRQRQE